MDRTKWTDDRLDDRFRGLDRELNLVSELGNAVRELTLVVREQSVKIDAQAKELIGLRDDNRTLGRTLTGFFVSLLIVLLGAMVGVIVAL